MNISIGKMLPTVTLAVILALSFLLPPIAVQAETPPHAAKKAVKKYQKYMKARQHRAFAISVGGAYGWDSKQSSKERAIEKAMGSCQQAADPCFVYSVNGKTVLDTSNWAAALAPYPSKAQAQGAPVGGNRGNMFPDLTFNTQDGQKKALSDYRGKLILVHIWAAWCPGCKDEMPELQKFYDRYKNNPDVVFVPISTREPFSKSLHWAESNGFSLPYVHTGRVGKKDKGLPMSDGGSINLNQIGKYIPSSFLLDRNGMVLWRLNREFWKWEEFSAQLDHAIANSN